jgi:hypothetical protein
MQINSCLLAISAFVTIYLKQFAVRLALIAKSTKIDATFMESELKCTKSKLNNAISKLATKVVNLELKINMQFECQAKPSRMT